VGDHQYRYVNDRNRIGSAQLPGHSGKASPNSVIVVDDDVGGSNQIEGDDKRPKERTDSCGQ
jgi:hypothetical protein